MDQLPKIRWRARRGMREMDRLFDQYLENHYPNASDNEKVLLNELLEMQDPELFDLLLLRIPAKSVAQEILIRKLNPYL